jgi:hypothetical protein
MTRGSRLILYILCLFNSKTMREIMLKLFTIKIIYIVAMAFKSFLVLQFSQKIINFNFAILTIFHNELPLNYTVAV